MSDISTHHARHFGFEPVNSDYKQDQVNQVFNQVAARYDVMNDMMSAGLHHHWKDRLMDYLRPAPDMHLLDMAGGTGDVAFRFLSRGGGKVTIADINQEMLDVGRSRAIDKNLDSSRISWSPQNAEALDLPDNYADAYTISFGIRNVTHLDKALAEAYRVLKRGGHFLCLEFSHLNHQTLQKLYDTYSFNVIPAMGARITGDREAYQYLIESIRQFPHADDFATLIGDQGFDNVTYRTLSQGIVAIHSAWKL